MAPRIPENDKERVSTSPLVEAISKIGSSFEGVFSSKDKEKSGPDENDADIASIKAERKALADRLREDQGNFR